MRLRTPLYPAMKSCVVKTSSTCVAVQDASVYASPLTSYFECDSVIDSSDHRFGPAVAKAIPFSGNSIIIGYGHSGSGKTYSIFGPCGVLEAISAELCSVQISFLQIYNEKVHDLLMPNSGPLPVMEDDSGVTQVRNLTQVHVESSDELFHIVELGLANRMVSPNNIHSLSSRSHAILQLKTPTRCVWLVDLAGSERTNPNLSYINSKISSREINNIHKSLHALRRCIAALNTASHKFLPARSSVLTRLIFSESVARCLLIACISPDKELVPETLSTLNFAGLCASASLQPKLKKHSQSETQLLRFALARLREELIAEKTRRMQLEREVGLLSSRSSTPPFSNPLVGTITKLNHSKKLASSTDESVLDYPANDSPKPSPIDLNTHPDLLSILDPPNADESVLSQTWRHNQYDAILQKCWQL